MISHRNVIANTLQIKAFEKEHRDATPPTDGRAVYSEIGLGLLPQNHIYSLVVICHAGAYRGDQTIILPKFEMSSYLNAIQTFKITGLFLVSSFELTQKVNRWATNYAQVPPIIINMLRLHDECSKYDLSSVKSLFTGAAPLGMETATDFQKAYPNVDIRQGYGKNFSP
jgi:acyl-CoA synthetase (AMP-forming)/AMP-acid ligase II